MKTKQVERKGTYLRAFRAAFPYTVPVLTGYLFIGMAFGVMIQEKGYNFLWAMLMSLVIYAGSGQYLAVNFFAPGVSLLNVIFMEFMVNIRHIFYGLSLLERFSKMGKKRLYMIFSLTDETYALLSSAKVPQGVKEHDYYFAVALLDQSYWILGSVIGAVAGALIPFSTEGVDFAMTALFVVIAVDQWRSYRKHLPAVLGAGVTVLFLIVLGHFFGQDQMLLISLGVIVLCLLVLRDRLDEKEEETC